MRVQKNPEIREKILNNNLGYAEMADAIGVSEATVFRWLRHELTAEQRQKIDAAFAALGVA